MNTRVLVLAALLAGACRGPIEDAMAALQDDHVATRLAAVRALAEAGTAAVAAVPALVAATGDETVADLAVWALGEVGPAAAAAVPQLLALPVDALPLRHVVVCVALAKTGGRRDDVVARLQRDLQSPHVVVRQAARGALRSLQ